MGGPSPPKASPTRRKKAHKLQRLPKDARIQKRPLLHPPIPSPYTGRQSQKVVYIGSKTPFMSAFKRVKQLLEHVDKRSIQSALAQRKRGQKPQLQPEADENPEAVVVKATGKAIDKTLGLALLLQQQTEYAVQIRTGSVAAIDDIVQATDGGAEDAEMPESRSDGAIDLEQEGSKEDDEVHEASLAQSGPANEVVKDEELPESRIRYTSVIEILVTLR